MDRSVRILAASKQKSAPFYTNLSLRNKFKSVTFFLFLLKSYLVGLTNTGFQAGTQTDAGDILYTFYNSNMFMYDVKVK